MTDIARSMRKKGYEPLAADSFGGIGFKKSLKGEGEESSQFEIWLGDIWFNTGKKMQDGTTPRTIAARNPQQYRDYLKKGLTPVKSRKGTRNE